MHNWLIRVDCASRRSGAALDTPVPNPARVHDYLLGECFLKDLMSCCADTLLPATAHDSVLDGLPAGD
jgi:hypothetical protein